MQPYIPRSTSARKATWRQAALSALVLATSTFTQARAQTDATLETIAATTATVPSRWGQASALMGSLFVFQGGKTQGTSGGGYTFSSAPNTAEMFALDLSKSFSASAPPWEAISVNAAGQAAPSVSFHSLSPIDNSRLLLFGGDGSPIVPVQTNNDSAYTITISGESGSRTAQYTPVIASWGQPMRRIYHTSESDTQGGIWILGGEKADGSSLLLDEMWNVNSTDSQPSFSMSTSSPPGSVAGGTSTLLSDGIILLLGGLDSNGQLQTMDQVYSFSTKSLEWGKTKTQGVVSDLVRRQSDSTGSIPAPRRGHVAVSLPDKRVFIQGGASADFSTIYSDAWILDWSVSPPVWTQLNSTGGPGSRYGHAAVAYGRHIVTGFGWAGANAADNSVHVFDGSTLTSNSQGSWTGGIWSTTYAPEPEAATSSTSSQGGSTSQPGNGFSSSSGGSISSSGDDDNASADGTATGAFPSSVPTEPTSSSESGPSAGEKAGAAIGALIGAGLVVGAGYAIYRRRCMQNWRHGDGAAGLLGQDGGDDYMMEKGEGVYDYNRPYHRDHLGEGLTGGAIFAGAAAGKRLQDRRDEGSPWTAANIGHAMEGSGPHFRERLAILTGLRNNALTQQPRFDMLADEEDSYSYRNGPAGLRRRHSLELEDEDEDEWQGDHVREQSHGRGGYGHAEDLSIGDIGGNGRYDDDEDYVTWPFEDSAGYRATPLSVGAALLGKREYERLSDNMDRENEYQHSDYGTEEGAPSDAHHSSTGPSVQSHTNTSSRSGNSGTASTGKSHELFSPGGLVSFSDSSHGKRSPRGPRGTPSSMMKRSPTWWARFKGNGFLERTASGRFLTGPNAELPIRDPTQPPELNTIAESPRVDEDPFHDSATAPGLDGDEGSAPFTLYQHGRSLSSLNSNRTATSSDLEQQLRYMDVVQRVRTGSSRRSASTRTGNSSDTDSAPAFSRNPTMLRARNLGPVEEDSPNPESIPGSVIWQPPQEDEYFNKNLIPPLIDAESTPDFRAVLRPSPTPSSIKEHVASEVPSITPATTKRARLNPLITAPFSPEAKKPKHEVLSGTVKDRVKAIEEHATDSDIPLPASPWTASLGTPSATTSETSCTSPSSKKSPVAKIKYTHGLAPKAQLFVANPDRRTSSGSS